jgi:hypothetical protein|nr:MAG TPA: hypothetical protein [Caudoviricetes sp.]
MTVREYAKLKRFEVVGKLKRLPDVYYGVENKSHYPLWIDEAGNEYCGSYNKDDCYCIITADGGVI